MAFADFQAYRDAVAQPAYVPTYTRSNSSFSNSPEGLMSQIRDTTGYPTNLAIPSTSVTKSKDSADGMWHPDGVGRKVFTSFGIGYPSEDVGVPVHGFVIVDRLVHQGGLSGTVTTVQTTNLPTAALTRYTDGVGVYAALQMWNVNTSSDLTVTVEYTNSAGTTGRFITFFMDANLLVNSVFPIPLVGGDLGVRSVESVDLGASLGAGDFGVLLYKPLCMVPMQANGHVEALATVGWNQAIHTDAFIDPFYHGLSPTGGPYTIDMGFDDV